MHSLGLFCALLAGFAAADRPARARAAERALRSEESSIRSTPNVLDFSDLPSGNIGCHSADVLVCTTADTAFAHLGDRPLSENVDNIGVRVTQADDGPRFTQAQVGNVFDVFELYQPPIPSVEAVTTHITPPGFQIQGSFSPSAFAENPTILRSIFNPYTAGHRFVLDPANSTVAYSVFLMRNVTVMLPDATFEGFSDSGVRDFIVTQHRRTTFCFANSQLLLQSCVGFPVEPVYFLCCTPTACETFNDVEFSEAVNVPLGPVEPLECFGAAGGVHAVDDSAAPRLSGAVIAIVVIFAVLALVLIALLATYRYSGLSLFRKARPPQLELRPPPPPGPVLHLPLHLSSDAGTVRIAAGYSSQLPPNSWTYNVAAGGLHSGLHSKASGDLGGYGSDHSFSLREPSSCAPLVHADAVHSSAAAGAATAEQLGRWSPPWVPQNARVCFLPTAHPALGAPASFSGVDESAEGACLAVGDADASSPLAIATNASSFLTAEDSSFIATAAPALPWFGLAPPAPAAASRALALSDRGGAGAAVPVDTQAVVAAVRGMAAAPPATPFAGRFEFTGACSVGSQAIVAWAHEVRDGNAAVAVRFFLSRAAFDAELEHYNTPPIAALLPPLLLHERNADAAHAGALPPFVITIRGTPLPTWAAVVQPTERQLLLMLAAVATHLAALHAGGYVHRRVAPSALLHLPGDRWCLAGTCAVVPIGEMRTLACHTSYAAPEIVSATQAATIVPAQPAHDLWSLAAVAFECLSGESVAAACGGAGKIVQCARGDECYPWELPESEQPAQWLASPARGVLEQCLQRPARSRPTVELVAGKLRVLAAAAL